jgi:hypothetical protein
MKRRRSKGIGGKSKRGLCWTTSSLAEAHKLEVVCRLLDACDHLLEFVFDPDLPRLRKSANDLNEAMTHLNHGEQLSVAAALDIWCGTGYFKLGKALREWTNDELTHFIQALCHLREIRNPVMHALIDDENSGIIL